MTSLSSESCALCRFGGSWTRRGSSLRRDELLLVQGRARMFRICFGFRKCLPIRQPQAKPPAREGFQSSKKKSRNSFGFDRSAFSIIRALLRFRSSDFEIASQIGTSSGTLAEFRHLLIGVLAKKKAGHVFGASDIGHDCVKITSRLRHSTFQPREHSGLDGR